MRRMRIQGTAYPYPIAKAKFVCANCCADIAEHNAGLACGYNPDHYGFFLRSEAESMSMEERYMRLSELFASEWYRGIDAYVPKILTIKDVKVERVKKFGSNQMEDQAVLVFAETPKKLRIGIMKGIQIMQAVGAPDDDVSHWLGKQITVYGDYVEAFGKVHFSPQVRPPQKGDVKFGDAEPPAYQTIEALLEAIHKRVGLDEEDAKNILREQFNGGFSPAKSAAMFHYAVSRVLDATVE